jgi:ribosomal protein S18 acetylase RimI-like enzyme
LAVVHATDGYPSRWPADPYAWLLPDAEAWVAELDGAVVGQALLKTGRDPGTALLGRLFVTPAGRGHRFGERLIAAALAAAAERELAVTLEVVDSGTAAIALYRRLGWQHTGTGPAPWLRPEDEPLTVHYFAAPAS